MSWVMLDRFVFRRDDDELFPDAEATHMRAQSLTSAGKIFNVALLPAAPPMLSRLYVQWPLSPPEEQDGNGRAAELVTARRGFLLLRITSPTGPGENDYLQDYFVFKAATSAGDNSRLRRLPACTQPIVLPYGESEVTMERWFHENTIGLVSLSGDGGGDEDEFAVVQLAKFVHIPGSAPKMGAELCVFCSRLPSSSSKSNTNTQDDDDDGVAEGEWEVLELSIQHAEEEFFDLKGWSADGAVTFGKSICWFDYHQGGILRWHRDALIDSEDLWYLNARQKWLMPDHAMTTFPLVSMDKPHLVHFLVSEPRKKNEIDDVSVVVIDIITHKIVSNFPYIRGEDHCGKDADMVMQWCRLPRSILPCHFY
ncbi:hypothetical protein CFC21_107439 [Triticum aestivum]|uniref:DUF1618 domain-containing protein n=3 Tax=Triticinae TaxID=1648030 RepID=A0A9R1MGQ9_WHEAT|nr:hypothetical protein CFC21_107434 [Triticum aestivum]KAF7106722.1 hypothetical protein CFC21_107439 [Triticum aestivum]